MRRTKHAHEHIDYKARRTWTHTCSTGEWILAADTSACRPVDVKSRRRLHGHLPPELHHRQIQHNSFSSHRSFKLIPVFVNLHLNTEAGFFWALKAAGCPSLRINRNIKLHVRRFTASLVTFYYCDGKISLNVQTLFVPAALLVVCIISWTRRLSPLVSLFFIFLGDLCASLIFLTAGLLQSSHYFKSALMGSMLWIPQAAFVPRYVIKAGTEH